MNETNRVLEMMASADKEMAILGMRLAFAKGAKWMEENIPCFGISATFKEADYLRSRMNTIDSREVAMTDGEVGARISNINIIDFRYMRDFNLGNISRDVSNNLNYKEKLIVLNQ